MILADTSVWIDHLRRGNGEFAALLGEGVVLCHEFILGELACGGLKNRQEILALLKALPEAARAEHDEVLALVTDQKLHGTGLGWIDVHLLASARLCGCTIWTLDKALGSAAKALKVDA